MKIFKVTSSASALSMPHGTYFLASEASERIKVLEEALQQIMYELGVPLPGFPHPKEAYDIALAALEVKP